MLPIQRVGKLCLGLGLALFLGGVVMAQDPSPTSKAKKKKPAVKSGLRLSSSSFLGGGMIPAQYTCKGKNISPELSWKGAPVGTKSFAVIVDDPDAPTQTWVHWVLFNIPAKVAGVINDTYEITENFPRDEKTPEGITQGSNDFNKIGYDGPCPPSGVHRYYFKLYALDEVLSLAAGSTKDQLLRAIKGHQLGYTQIMGLCGK